MDEWFVGRRITLVGIGQLSQYLLSLSFLFPSLPPSMLALLTCVCVNALSLL